MKRSLSVASCLIVLGLASVYGIESRARPASSAPKTASTSTSTNTTESNITRLTTSILGRSQFAHHPLDSELAGKFLDSYLDALDGSRSLFLQSDVAEFGAYRKTLAQAAVTGDTSVARAIFDRFVQRLSERAAFVADLLAKDHFDFTGHDTYSFDREHATRPRDLAAAHDLWRQGLRAEYLQEKLGDMPPEKIATKLNRRYTQQLVMMKGLGKDEVLQLYLNALAHVYDPHSDYLGHEEMESLSITMNLSLFGIGAALENADGFCTIREVLPGGPAARGGILKPGDRIVGVAQAGKEPVDVVNMPLTRTVDLIRGPKGSMVTLQIVPAGAPDGSPPKSVALVRDEIQLEDQEAKAKIVDLPRSNGTKLRLGVIDVPAFYADMGDDPKRHHRSVTADVAALVTKLKAEKVQGIALDLRHNGGGSLKEAIDLTGLFIKTGPVVQTRGAKGDIEVDADTDPTELYDGPLIVLTSRFSASASEILSGALQDYGRAVIVGDSQTFGKGTVQTVLPLARVMDEGGLVHTYDPGALKITIRKFYRPGGASTQLRGVASDIVLPSTSDFSDVSESALKDPLPWDAVPGAPHDRLSRVKPYVDALRKKSLHRVSTEKGFALLRDDIARLKKDLSSKTVSLNEAERRKELVEAKKRRAASEKEIAALKVKRPTSYEITLKNASKQGLPAPFVPKPKPANPAANHGAVDDAAASEDLAEDVTLHEDLQILADYTELVRGRAGHPPP